MDRPAQETDLKIQHQQPPAAAPQPRRRLQRRNAAKNIGYDASTWCSYPRSPSCGRSGGSGSSLHLTSFRIGGSGDSGGDIQLICRSLGLSGPDDFAIPLADWEAHKAGRSDSSASSPHRTHSGELGHQDPSSPPPNPCLPEPPAAARGAPAESAGVNLEHFGSPDSRAAVRNEPVEPAGVDSEYSTSKDSPAAARNEPAEPSVVSSEDFDSPDSPVAARHEPAQLAGANLEVLGGNLGVSANKGRGDGGIRGPRPPPVLAMPLVLKPPPVLKPLPSMALLAVDDVGSTWDILRSFAPNEEDSDVRRRSSGLVVEKVEEEEEEEAEEEVVRLDLLRLGETSEDFTGTSSLSTTNDDETSSTTTETMFYISPNGRFKRKILSWNRGMPLGSGSFGTVYEGISDEGVFFAVKEVCLHDKGIDAQQCILQLEQEIALLSQFEHENIVQYYGTDKEDSKLFIFLELVTQGSLASLYQKYRLRDSHVSAYTRQILSGLVYLHDRNIVHRDIKCANILVHANGSVKLADFGLAKQITEFNMLKSCKGTVYWMAPEVVKPGRTYGPAADIWSLGCTVMEMLTRQLPYPNLEWTQALFKIGQGEPPNIPDSLSKDARDFINRCIKLNPEDRPTASELLEHPFVKRSMRSSSRLNSTLRYVDREL